MNEYVLEGFLKYGIGKATSAGRIVMAFEREKKFVAEGVLLAQVIDLTVTPLTTRIATMPQWPITRRLRMNILATMVMILTTKSKVIP